MNATARRTIEPGQPLEPVEAQHPLLDPRETAQAFLELPADVQEVVRSGWRESEERDARVIALRQADRKLAIVHAVTVFLPVHLVLQGFSALGILGALGFAVLVGESWSRFRTGQIATPMIAASVFFLFELLWISSNPFHALGHLVATTFVAMCSAYLGLRRELRVME